ncbi:uncharacterized protein [Ambystoma mexicanum]|uniref:uncharacterized protein isoform X2 n=1 Tax=Ambystoma mexicanum TaxID=8296 RepID=UPI0037E87DC4
MAITVLKWCIVVAGVMSCEAQGNISLSEMIPTEATTTISVLATKNTTVSIPIVSNENVTAAEPTIPQPTNQSTSGLLQDQADSHFSPRSHQSETSHLPSESNMAAEGANKESNDLNDIFTGEDELLNLKEGTETPAQVHADFGATLLLGHSQSHDTHLDGIENNMFTDASEAEITGSNTESPVLGLESWKIGVISAAVFLVLEAIVLVIYCRVCRHRKKRTVVVNKNCEQDSEAAETINAESNENTLHEEDGTLNLVSIKDALEFPETTEEDQRIQCLLSLHHDHPQYEVTNVEL